MKRFAIIALLVLALAGCGSATTQATTATPTETPDVDATAVAAQNTADANAGTPAAGSCAANPSQCATQAPQPTQAPTQAAPTHTYSGDGSKTTETFSVSDSWIITWTCDATNNYGVDGELSVLIYDSQNNLLDNLLETCKANMTSKGSSQEHQGGNVYLKIDGSIPWTIAVQDNG